MGLFVCGVNHKSASVEMREQLAIGHEHVAVALKNLIDQEHIHEGVILSTCNRTEMYCIADDEMALLHWLQSRHCNTLSAQEFYSVVYSYKDEAALEHMMRVASGLDSMVVGEPQILGQIKDAYVQADDCATISTQLKRIMQAVFATAKKVRTETAVGMKPVSVAFTAVNLVKSMFTDLAAVKALFIGAGDTIELATKYLVEQGLHNIYTANRTLAHAQSLVAEIDGVAVGLEEVPRLLSDVDIVISATSSYRAIIEHDMVVSARESAQNPLYIIDLGVPRDVEASVAELANVHLYNIDDLEKIIQESYAEREEAAQQANLIIQDATVQYRHLVRECEFIDTIRAYREQVEQLRDDEINKALHALHTGTAAEEVLNQLAHALTKKLMHHPSIQLRQARNHGQTEFLHVAKQLFNIANET